MRITPQPRFPSPHPPAPSAAPTAPSVVPNALRTPQEPLTAPSGQDVRLGAVPAAPAQAWTAQDVPFNASTMFLLTDGRVLAEDEGADNNGTKNWWILTPDANGSYQQGSWRQVASASKDRVYFASAVLPDGRVLVVGGEYTGGKQSEDNTGEIYDPVKNTWSPIKPPTGWSEVGDAPCTLLPDGRLLLGSISDSRTAIYDPKTNSWTDGGKKLAPSAEESWVLMPGGAVLTVDCSRTRGSELWVPGKGWMDAGKLPVDLVQPSSDEIGSGLLLNDGRAFFVGATGHTAVYSPNADPTKPGTWAAGPDMPKDAQGHPFVSKDAPAVLLPNGHVIIAAASLGSDPSNFGDTTSFFDFDPQTMQISPTATPPNASQPPFEGRFMRLPSGETLFANGTKQVSFQAPGGDAPPTFRPVITSLPPSASAGSTIEVQGQRLNGVSQTIGYGDDAEAATNYPLVRLTDQSTGHVFYARTHDHSTMGVATGEANVSTQATLPADLPPGTYALQVVANGIASDPVALTVR